MPSLGSVLMQCAVNGCVSAVNGCVSTIEASSSYERACLNRGFPHDEPQCLVCWA